MIKIINDWPIFVAKENTSQKPFWDKIKNDFNFKDDDILVSNSMFRIGKTKQVPKQFTFYLLKTGLLYYKGESVKGRIQLDLSIIIKKIEMTNEEDQKQKKIMTIRIERFKSCQIYIWSHENQNITNLWYKSLAQFCVSSNFDGFFKICENIDQGAFSSVFVVASLLPQETKNKQFAAKVYSKDLQQKIPAKQMKDFITSECEILKLAKSEFIVELFEVIQLDDVVILILELINGGTLTKFIKSETMSELMSCEICYQIAQGLKLVHSFGYVHRDIKLDNILVQQQMPLKIKIIDFGFAEKIKRDKLVNGQGTAGYIAPELFESSPFTENCEIFSLGILFFILLSGNFPFRSANYEVLLERNKQCQIRFQCDEWKNISSSAQRIVQRMLEKDPVRRITLSELVILLELHVGNLKSNSQSSRLIVKGIAFEMIEKSPNKLAQAIKCQEEDDIQAEEKSIDNTNLFHLQQSQQYYNKCKWKL